MPGYIDPCDPVLRKVPPSGDDWLYEIKWDGYRAQLHIRPGKIIVYSRKGFDWTDRFAAIALAAKDLRVREAVIDGEAVVLGSKGIADFQALRRELGRENSEKLTYYAFDLLWLNGKDLRSLPLVERKQRLRKLIDKEDSPTSCLCGGSLRQRAGDLQRRLPPRPRRRRRQAPGCAIPLRRAGILDQGQMHADRHVPDGRVRREAGRQAAAHRFALSGTVGRRSSALRR